MLVVLGGCATSEFQAEARSGGGQFASAAPPAPRPVPIGGTANQAPRQLVVAAPAAPAAASPDRRAPAPPPVYVILQPANGTGPAVAQAQLTLPAPQMQVAAAPVKAAAAPAGSDAAAALPPAPPSSAFTRMSASAVAPAGASGEPTVPAEGVAEPTVRSAALAQRPQELPAAAEAAADTAAATPNALPAAGVALAGSVEEARVPAGEAAAAACRSGAEIRFVNSKRVSLHYDLKGDGAADVAGVDLWCTRDGRTWTRRELQSQDTSACVTEVEDEDLYGFTLVPRAGAKGARPPQDGDRPQVWMEVDVTKPTVRLLGVEAEKKGGRSQLTVRWRATDKNLGARPVSLSYAAEPAGPWEPIVTAVENTGRYVWAVPAHAPRRLYLRVEATDLAGNAGSAQTPDPIGDEPAAPTVSIRAVEAVD
jgi:hypothetical protein